METGEIEKVYRKCLPLVHHHLCVMLGNEHDAWDITQDAFVSYIRYRDKGRNVSSPYRFLLRTATRLALRFLRKRASRPSVELADSLLAEGFAYTTVEARLTLSKLFGRLDPKGRLVAKLYLLDGMKGAEIVDLTGLPAGQVKRRISKIKRLMEKQERITVPKKIVPKLSSDDS